MFRKKGYSKQKVKGIYLYSESTERALLGALMQEPANIDLAKKWIENTEVFYFDFHRSIWETMLKLEKSDERIDPVSILHNYPQKKNVKKSLAYEITLLATEEIHPSRSEYYAKILHGYWLIRLHMTVCDSLRISSTLFVLSSAS